LLVNSPSTHFIGVRVDALTFDELFERVDTWLQDKSGPAHHVACINVYCATLTLEDPRLAAIYARADVAGADGMPFVHWIRAFVRADCDRLYGPDIISGLAERARDRGYTFYLFGGAADVLESMKRNLEARFPHIRIVGMPSPPFRPLTDEEDQAVCAEINQLRPDFVLVGLGTPKQDYWIDDHRDKLPGTVLLAVGAAFDFFGGRVKMAPRFVQRSGFEWLYRLAGPDFARLWRRYTVYNAKFLWHFARQLTKR
jgi:N-acetylglucosaminyldiphosphoundecaprenol N-acetyl-beta-D-mannosaminyltransferase